MRFPAAVGVLARAFLAGESGGRALGKEWPWLGPLFERFQWTFEARTRPRMRDVVVFLLRDPRLAEHLHELSVGEWPANPQRMQPVAAAAGWAIPAIESAGALAAWLRVEPAELDWYADLKGLNVARLEHYHYRVLPRRSGGVRVIEAPKARLKELQRRVLTGILDYIPPHAAAHGFRKGRSIRSFIAPHVSRQVVLRLDLREFFPSIAGVRIQALFRTAGYPESVADLLGGICTNITPRKVSRDPLYRRPHLPQGAPTSPALANLCAYRVDCRLAALAEAAGAVYTRYADDLAFSGDEEFARRVERFSLHAAAILLEEGFQVNHRKTRIMRQGVRQRLAGLVANRVPNVPRNDFDRLKATLANCIRLGPESQNRASHPHFRMHLEGRVGFLESINPARGKRLRALLEQIRWS